MAMVWALVIVELGGRLGGVRQHHRKVLGEKAGAWLRPVDLNSTLGGKIRYVLPFSLAIRLHPLSLQHPALRMDYRRFV